MCAKVQKEKPTGIFVCGGAKTKCLVSEFYLNLIWFVIFFRVLFCVRNSSEAQTDHECTLYGFAYRVFTLMYFYYLKGVLLILTFRKWVVFFAKKWDLGWMYYFIVNDLNKIILCVVHFKLNF